MMNLMMRIPGYQPPNRHHGNSPSAQLPSQALNGTPALGDSVHEASEPSSTDLRNHSYTRTDVNQTLQDMIDATDFSDISIPPEADTIDSTRQITATAPCTVGVRKASGMRRFINAAWRFIKDHHPSRATTALSAIQTTATIATHMITGIALWKISIPITMCFFVYLRCLPERQRRGNLSRILAFNRTLHNKAIVAALREPWQWSTMRPYRTRESHHAHAVSANARCQATTTIGKLIRRVNGRLGDTETRYKRYDVATSSRECKWNVDGDRLVYDQSDLAQEVKDDELKNNHFVTMVDVDFHLKSWSRYSQHPVLAYTRIPEAVAGITKDGHYRLECKEGRALMTEVVNGGAIWQSGVWDYSSDMCINRNWFSYTISNIEKFEQPDIPGRFIVAILPRVTIRHPYWLTRLMFRVCGLSLNEKYSDLAPISNVKSEGAYTIARFNRNTQDLVDLRYTTQQDAGYTSLPAQEFYNIKINGIKDNKTLTLSNLQHIIQSDSTRAKSKTPESASRVGNTRMLHNYFNNHLRQTIPEPLRLNYIYTLAEEGEDDESYASMETGAPDAKLCSEPITSQTVVAPTACIRNTLSGVKARVTNMANKKVPSQEYTRYADEFIRFVAGQAILVPKTMDEVIDNQKKPNQKVRNDNFKRTGKGTKARAKPFAKKEVYLEPKASRLITGVNTEDTVLFGKYMAAVKDYLKRYSWFMPGCTPEQTASRIHTFCHNKRQVLETDYSKWDGSLSCWMRDIEQRLFQKLFKGDDELKELLERDRDLKATTRDNVVYDVGDARMSGSQSTTVGNTILNAYIAYAAYRIKGLDAKTSFSTIGPKYGDDGIDDDRGDFTTVCEALGIKLKCDIRQTDSFVTFCGRYYIRPKYGRSSVFNVRKAIMSLPVTVRSTPNAHQHKTNGYLAMDPHTPLLSQYARAINRIYGYSDAIDLNMIDNNDRMKIEAGPYPMAECDHDAAIGVIAQQLNVTPSEVYCAMAALDAAMTVNDLECVTKFNTDFTTQDIAPVRFVEGGDRIKTVMRRIDLRQGGYQLKIDP